MVIKDGDVVKAFAEFNTKHGWADATFDDLEKHVEGLLRHIRAAFPGISDEQFHRCHRIGLEDPDDDAKQAEIAGAVYNALKVSGANNLLEVLELGGPIADDLAAQIEAIHKGDVSKN